MTRNPVHAEMDGSSIRFYFMPEDDRSFIYVYRVTPDVRDSEVELDDAVRPGSMAGPVEQVVCRAGGR